MKNMVDESCTHKTFLSNHLCYKHSKLLARKIPLPDELPIFQQRDLNESIAPAGFQFKELDSCILYPFPFDGTKFLKILEFNRFNRLDDDLHVKTQCNGMLLPLPQWFVQGHYATMKNEVI